MVMVIEAISIGVVCRSCGREITTRDEKKAAVLSAMPERLKSVMRCPRCHYQAEHPAVTPPIVYQIYIRSDAWRQKANEAKERAGQRCQVCNGTERLQAHHRNYDRLGYELPEDITILCDECHELFSKQGRLK